MYSCHDLQIAYDGDGGDDDDVQSDAKLKACYPFSFCFAASVTDFFSYL